MRSDFSLNKGLSVPVSILNPKSYVISTTNMLGCGSFVRGRKIKKVDSRPSILTSEEHTGEASWDFSIHQYNLPSIPIIYNIPNPFST